MRTRLALVLSVAALCALGTLSVQANGGDGYAGSLAQESGSPSGRSDPLVIPDGRPGPTIGSPSVTPDVTPGGRQGPITTNDGAGPQALPVERAPDGPTAIPDGRTGPVTPPGGSITPPAPR